MNAAASLTVTGHGIDPGNGGIQMPPDICSDYVYSFNTNAKAVIMSVHPMGSKGDPLPQDGQAVVPAVHFGNIRQSPPLLKVSGQKQP